MRPLISGTPLALLVLALTAGCTDAPSRQADGSDSSQPTASPTNDQSSVDPSATAAAPLALTTDIVRGRSCVSDRTPADLAWYEVTVKAEEDVTIDAIELETSPGVKRVGPALVVPLRPNEIPATGSWTWEARHKFANRRAWRWADRQAVGADSQAHLRAGDTAMLVLHLRYDHRALKQTSATFSGVLATYHVGDQRGEAHVDLDLQVRARQRC